MFGEQELQCTFMQFSFRLSFFLKYSFEFFLSITFWSFNLNSHNALKSESLEHQNFHSVFPAQNILSMPNSEANTRILHIQITMLLAVPIAVGV
jgi:hypothetical protein